MKLILPVTMIFFLVISGAQSQDHIIQAKKLLRSLDGDFKWKIFKPSEDKIVREGFRYGRLKMDSLIVQIEETFNASDIRMTGLIGYNSTTKEYFSINCYNVDMGPHIILGNAMDESRIEFVNEDEISILRILGPDVHEWSYLSKVNDQWVSRDMRIIFTRIP